METRRKQPRSPTELFRCDDKRKRDRSSVAPRMHRQFAREQQCVCVCKCVCKGANGAPVVCECRTRTLSAVGDKRRCFTGRRAIATRQKSALPRACRGGRAWLVWVCVCVCVYKPGCHGGRRRRRRSVRHLLALRQCMVSLSSRQGDAGGSLQSTSNERHRERSVQRSDGHVLPQQR